MQRKQTCLMFFKEEFHNVLLLCSFLSSYIVCFAPPTGAVTYLQGIKWTRDAKVYFSTLWPLVLTTSPQFTFAGFVYLKKKKCQQLILWRPAIKNLSRHSSWDHGETCMCCHGPEIITSTSTLFIFLFTVIYQNIYILELPVIFLIFCKILCWYLTFTVTDHIISSEINEVFGWN